MDKDRIRRIAAKTALGVAAVVFVGSIALYLLWRDRPDLGDISWPLAVNEELEAIDVTITWLGVANILFDDGQTQILVDAFISRPTLADAILQRPVSSDIPRINSVMHDFRMRGLAAIVATHSHYDHAMDVGAIANRSSASILGSESTANVARGAGVPEDQILVVEPGQVYEFGEFTVTLYESPHAPIGWRSATPLPGTIDEPLEMPAPITAWREGGSYSIVISHPQGTSLVQGSAGFKDNRLADVQADVVFLSVGMLGSLGREYAGNYWRELVTATGATRVIPVHFDDLTAPFGNIRLAPRFIDNFVKTAGWLSELQQTWDTDVELYLPVFGEKVGLYSLEGPPSS